MRPILQRLWSAAFVAACLSASLAAQSVSAQAPAWPEFHGTTDDQRRKADLFDLAGVSPLEPNASRGVGSDKENLPGPIPPYAEFLQFKICSSDVVAVGTPRSKQAFLTSHESSILTDYDFVVTESMRGGAGNGQPTVVTHLTVTLVGGRIDTKAGPLEVTDDPPLDLNQPYILLLSRIPATRSYELRAPALALGSTATALQGNRRAPPELLSGSLQSSVVLADVRRLAATCASGGAQ
jgi:hypothetical protein